MGRWWGGRSWWRRDAGHTPRPFGRACPAPSRGPGPIAPRHHHPALQRAHALTPGTRRLSISSGRSRFWSSRRVCGFARNPCARGPAWLGPATIARAINGDSDRLVRDPQSRGLLDAIHESFVPFREQPSGHQSRFAAEPAVAGLGINVPPDLIADHTRRAAQLPRDDADAPAVPSSQPDGRAVHHRQPSGTMVFAADVASAPFP